MQEALRLNPDHAKAGAAFKRLRNIQRAIDGGKAAADKREFDEAIELFTKVHSSPTQRPLSHCVKNTVTVLKHDTSVRVKREHVNKKPVGS